MTREEIRHWFDFIIEFYRFILKSGPPDMKDESDIRWDLIKPYIQEKHHDAFLKEIDNCLEPQTNLATLLTANETQINHVDGRIGLTFAQRLQAPAKIIGILKKYANHDLLLKIGDYVFQREGSKKILAQFKEEQQRKQALAALSSDDHKKAFLIQSYEALKTNVLSKIDLHQPQSANLKAFLAYCNNHYVPLDVLKSVLHYLNSKEGKRSKHNQRIGDLMAILEPGQSFVCSWNHWGYRRMLAYKSIPQDWHKESMDDFMCRFDGMHLANDDKNVFVNVFQEGDLSFKIQMLNHAEINDLELHVRLIEAMKGMDSNDIDQMIDSRLDNGYAWSEYFRQLTHNDINAHKDLLMRHANNREALDRIHSGLDHQTLLEGMFALVGDSNIAQELKMSLLNHLGYALTEEDIQRIQDVALQLDDPNRNSTVWLHAREVDEDIEWTTLRRILARLAFKQKNSTRLLLPALTTSWLRSICGRKVPIKSDFYHEILDRKPSQPMSAQRFKRLQNRVLQSNIRQSVTGREQTPKKK